MRWAGMGASPCSPPMRPSRAKALGMFARRRFSDETKKTEGSAPSVFFCLVRRLVFGETRAHGAHPSRTLPQSTEVSGLICGNSMTSRMFWASVISITSLSMPTPQPPVGGRPYSMARM